MCKKGTGKIQLDIRKEATTFPTNQPSPLS